MSKKTSTTNEREAIRLTVKASDAIRVARAEIGTKATNYRKCKYNTWYYGTAVSGDAYHWCAVFICWVFYQLGTLISLLYLKTASCGYMAKAFLDKGRLIRPKSLTAVLLAEQCGAMGRYLRILEARAKAEGIALD